MTNVVSATEKRLLECYFKEMYNRRVAVLFHTPPPPNTYHTPWEFTISLYAHSILLQISAAFHLRGFLRQ